MSLPATDRSANRGPRPPGVTAQSNEWSAAVAALRSAAGGTNLAPAVDLACRQGLVLRRAQAKQCGVDDASVRRLVARGRWAVPRRGILSPLSPHPSAQHRHPNDRSRSPHGLADQIRAAALTQARPGTIVSHDSAAAVHGLPLLHPIARPTLSVVDDDHRVARADATIRCVGMHPGDVTSWWGAPVTTVARTVVDIARADGVAAGLVAADAALHAVLLHLDDLALARERASYRPGVRGVDRVIELADGRAESPLETLARLCLIDGGLPPADLQVWVDTERGRYRVDLLYADERVIIEADGGLKYADPARPYALVEEKRRQEALERAGYRVVRVTWWDVWREPWDVVARVRRAMR